MKKQLTRLAAIFLAVLATISTTAKERPLTQLPYAASTYQPSQFPQNELPKLTPSPKGYRPFHIEHYGRHGSRRLIGDDRYSLPVKQLEIAERNNALTPLGKETLAELRQWLDDSYKRDGELTQVGAEQHRGVARRMASNFPQAFAPGTQIDARSTLIIRCILSMLNAMTEIKSIYPDLNFRSDASDADVYYMKNPNSTPERKDAMKKAKKALKKFNTNHPVSGDWLNKVISNKKLITDSIDVENLTEKTYDIAVNSASHGTRSKLIDLFSPEEKDRLWERRNAYWFHYAGNSKISDNLAPFSQANLLRNIIESADTAMTSPRQSVNLRYGHDSVVLPLTVLMELDDYGKEVNKFNDVAYEWNAAEIFPMACNIQMIFYRKKDTVNPDDVLVKVLLNEHEARLPIKTDTFPYYKWNDMKKYYLDKLASKGYTEYHK